FGKEESPIFLGREMGRVKDHSEATAVLIDKEIRALVDAASGRAEKLLSANLDKLNLLAEALLERETLTGDDVNELFGVAEKREGDAAPDRAEKASSSDGKDESDAEASDHSPPPEDAEPPTE
ncbi:MAG: cell division protein FtsH, partial [Candidatus Eisenbacteria sp.]|nr:cell division protein FtsH [Candidatus Eisenbacteria bacterium]